MLIQSQPQADKLTSIIKAANVPEVEPIWATLFAKVSRYSITITTTTLHFELQAHYNEKSRILTGLGLGS